MWSWRNWPSEASSKALASDVKRLLAKSPSDTGTSRSGEKNNMKNEGG